MVPGKNRNFTENIFKINKWGVGISAGGWEKFQKLEIGEGDDYSVFKSRNLSVYFFCYAPHLKCH